MNSDMAYCDLGLVCTLQMSDTISHVLLPRGSLFAHPWYPVVELSKPLWFVVLASANKIPREIVDKKGTPFKVITF